MIFALLDSWQTLQQLKSSEKAFPTVGLEFNNKIKDAQLGHIYDDVPCKDCEKSILKEASELNKECGRLIEHYNKDEISPSQISEVCCVNCSKGKFDRICIWK